MPFCLKKQTESLVVTGSECTEDRNITGFIHLFCEHKQCWGRFYKTSLRSLISRQSKNIQILSRKSLPIFFFCLIVTCFRVVLLKNFVGIIILIRNPYSYSCKQYRTNYIIRSGRVMLKKNVLHVRRILIAFSMTNISQSWSIRSKCYLTIMRTHL